MNWRISLCLLVTLAFGGGTPATSMAAKKHQPNAEPAGTPSEDMPRRNGSITIAGTVFKNTKAVGGARVQLKLLRHTGRQRAVRGGRHGALTNADGHFSFSAAPGAYAVVASKKGIGRASARTVLTANENQGQLRLFLNHQHRHGHWRRHHR